MGLRVRVCNITEIADRELRAFKVDGVTWPVIVTILDGELIATAGVCPHEDVSLKHGWLEGDQLVCPGHAYEFDLHTGRCKHAPALELKRYKVTRLADEIWVDLI